MRSSLRRLRLLAFLPLALASGSCAEPAAAGPVVTVYKTPTCGCCASWVEHLVEHGFRVETIDREDLTPIKQQYGVPQGMLSCHTAIVDGYVIEGHVPMDVIDRLLTERPAVAGIGVPGMPMGSPGMEGPRSEPYEIYTFDASGPKGIYAAR